MYLNAVDIPAVFMHLHHLRLQAPQMISMAALLGEHHVVRPTPVPTDMAKPPDRIASGVGFDPGLAVGRTQCSSAAT